jgi:hypothetical protein
VSSHGTGVWGSSLVNKIHLKNSLWPNYYCSSYSPSPPERPFPTWGYKFRDCQVPTSHSRQESKSSWDPMWLLSGPTSRPSPSPSLLMGPLQVPSLGAGVSSLSLFPQTGTLHCQLSAGHSWILPSIPWCVISKAFYPRGSSDHLNETLCSPSTCPAPFPSHRFSFPA